MKSLLKNLAITSIHIYQLLIGPCIRMVLINVFGTALACKFSPSCSQFTIEQIREHGTISGLKRGLRRIGECH